MSTDRPPWVVKDLSTLLGLDQDSISQLVLPDLEGYVNETKLKFHLQDFLGPTPQAKSFITKYLSLRFPRLPTDQAPSLPSGPIKPLFSQPASAFGPTTTTTAVSRSKPASSTGTPTRQPPPPQSIPDALEAAFGPSGRVYQKNRDADLSSFTGPRPVGVASGSVTPARQVRQAGGLTVTEARPKPGSERNSQKGKQREEKVWDAPKSIVVKRLESLVRDLQVMQQGEGKVGRVEEGKECFCQARVHPLSHHTPQCPSCGLIQCHLQPPHRACPSCFRPLLTPSSLARLLLRVQTEIEEQLAKEQKGRDDLKRAEMKAVEAAAAFPYLAGAGSGSGGSSGNLSVSGKKEEKGHKVLTINKGKGKITLTTTHTPPPPQVSTPPVEERYSEAVVSRPRSPPLESARTEKELAKTRKWRQEEDRPLGDMKAAKKGEGWKYVEMAIVEVMDEDRVGRRRKGKGRGEGVNGRAVPGAVVA